MMNYDEALARIEAIVRELEQAEAISVTEYREKAAEAKRLLDYCEGQVVELENELAK